MLDINSRIAARVKQLRSAAGISLEALATRAKVSRSMLSLVERGETSPTAVVLEKIATGLGTTLAALFDEPGTAPSPVSRDRDRVAWKDPQSGYVRRNISPANFPSPIRIVEVSFPPGAKVSYDGGRRETAVAQQVWVRRGAIEITVGKAVHDLSQGDCLAMQLDSPVTFRNRRRQTAHYIVVLAS